MDKIGIIAEFNPFHNGHVYLINKIKKKFPNSFITVVLSTNFSERGEISMLTKWDKTRLALEYGVDLVVELPFIFATQSADIFSNTSIKILESLKMDYLVFGSETNDVDVLKNLASTILYNQEYPTLLKKYLKLGNSYPSSVSKALYNLTNIELINSNDILGVTYIKTILENDYDIKPITIKRTNSYLSKNTTGNISSATCIRDNYFNNKDISNYIPKETLKYLTIEKDILNNYYNILKYKLITDIDNLDNYLDVSEGIQNKIKKNILNTNSYHELIESLKSKRYTYNKLNRMFLHMLMNIKKEETYDLNYIRILGFTKKGRNYLKNNKDNFNIPIITNYKDIDDNVLKLELRASILYLNLRNESNLIKEELKSIPINRN